MLTSGLVAVALIAGVAGTWSPCGFSIIDTISSPQRRVAASAGAFALGACIGGAGMLGTLALAGAALVGDRLAVGAPAAAATAAVFEALGLAVVPQIRRQVPEHWRRILPLPVAAGFYGVLLGAGFTTFVYTFALWALAVIVVVLGDPAVGVVVGIAFGLGRALPVLAIAPVAQQPYGRRLLDVMAQRPLLWASVRRVAAVCLVVVAVAGTTDGLAATRLGLGTDPSASGGVVVWTTPSGGVALREGETATSTVPAHATVGGSLLAWRDGETVHVVRLADMSPVLDVDVPGVSAVAVSDTWLVVRVGTRELNARALAAPTVVQTVATVRSPARIGRPALDGNELVYHVAARTGSRIVAVDLASARTRVVRHAARQLLTNPAVLAGELLYNRQTSAAQLVELGPLDQRGRDRVVYRLTAPSRHDAGHEAGYSPRTRNKRPPLAKWRLWTTALSAERAYVTLLPRVGNAASATLVSIARPLGRSVRERAISALEVGNPAGRVVLVVGCIHGDEPAGIAVARWLARNPPPDLDLWIVPVLNPDGRAAGTRGNAHGVDLNRNFPYRWRRLDGVYESGPRPLSEPEARSAYRLIRRIRPEISVWFHQHLGLVWASGGSSRIERRFAAASGLPYRPLPALPGSAIDWQNHALPGTTAFAAELPAGSPSAAAVRRYARAVLAAARS